MQTGKSTKPLLILGTGVLAVEIADLISQVPGFRTAGFVENMDRKRCTETLEGLPVLWIDDIADLAPTHWAVGGLATTHRGRFSGQTDAVGMAFATIVHPTARVSPTAILGEGCIVSSGALIAAHVRLGRHVFVNRGAMVGHHTEIGDFCSLGPGVNIGGLGRISERVYLGIGAIVVDRISIGARSVVGAGALVVKDVPARVQVIGAPARITKRNIDGK